MLKFKYKISNSICRIEESSDSFPRPSLPYTALRWKIVLCHGFPCFGVQEFDMFIKFCQLIFFTNPFVFYVTSKVNLCKKHISVKNLPILLTLMSVCTDRKIVMKRVSLTNQKRQISHRHHNFEWRHVDNKAQESERNMVNLEVLASLGCENF